MRRWSSVLGRVAAAAVVLLVAGCAGGAGPGGAQYVAIGTAPAVPRSPAVQTGGSTGTWRVDCGRNERGIRNSDNLVVNPRESGGAHHLHDYVGNVSTTAFSTDRSLAAAATTCRGGDRSTYYWPVLRVPGKGGHAGHQATDDAHGNDGRILVPDSVLIEFRGSPISSVVAMPEFLRTATGNAHGYSTGGEKTDHLQWTCSGARDRVTKDYPRCKDGQQVVRVFDFPSCWNGKSTDSPNHSSHLVFPDSSGGCPHATFPVPQLHLELAYSVPRGADFAIDTFDEEKGSSLADHAHFIDVMTPALMNKVVSCINENRHCQA